jgi:hypothetical protein
MLSIPGHQEQENAAEKTDFAISKFKRLHYETKTMLMSTPVTPFSHQRENCTYYLKN